MPERRISAQEMNYIPLPSFEIREGLKEASDIELGRTIIVEQLAKPLLSDVTKGRFSVQEITLLQKPKKGTKKEGVISTPPAPLGLSVAETMLDEIGLRGFIRLVPAKASETQSAQEVSTNNTVVGYTWIKDPEDREKIKEGLRGILSKASYARETFVKRYNFLVKKLANTYSDKGVGWQELVAVASEGLSSAIYFYDSTRGVRLHYLAEKIIQRALYKYFRDEMSIIGQPRESFETRVSVNNAVGDLLHELDRPPTIIEIAKRAKVGPEIVRGILEYDAQVSVSGPDS